MKLLNLVFLIIINGALQAQATFPLDYCDCEDTINSIDTIPDGEFKRHCNGKLVIKGKFINGLKDGAWLTYSSNGVLIREFNYNKGLLSGKVEMWYSTGTDKLKGNFVNGRKDGIWEYYSKNGKILKKGSFENGKPVDKWKIYGLKGKKAKIVYDFENEEYIKNKNEAFLFKNAEVIQNDNSHEWYIRQESTGSLGNLSAHPFEGYEIARELHTVITEIPLDYWETFVSLNYVGKMSFKDGGIESIELSLRKKHSKEGGEIGFFAITNDIDKLHKIKHNKLSMTLLKYNIVEALWMSGPWLTKTKNIHIYTPYVINQFKNRTF